MQVLTKSNVSIFTVLLDSKDLKILTPFIIFPTFSYCIFMYMYMFCHYQCFIYYSFIFISSSILSRCWAITASLWPSLLVLRRHLLLLHRWWCVSLSDVWMWTSFYLWASYLQNILNLWFGFFQSLWKILSHYLFKYCFCTMSPLLRIQLHTHRPSSLPLHLRPFPWCLLHFHFCTSFSFFSFCSITTGGYTDWRSSVKTVFHSWDNLTWSLYNIFLYTAICVLFTNIYGGFLCACKTLPGLVVFPHCVSSSAFRVVLASQNETASVRSSLISWKSFLLN